MRLAPLLSLLLWTVVARGQEPEATTSRIQQYHQQDTRGGYRFGYNTDDQIVNADRDTNGEVKGKYTYVDVNGDMQGVKDTAGVNGYMPKTLSNKQEAEASLLEPDIIQPNTEDIAMGPTGYNEENNDSIKDEMVNGKYTFIDKDGLPATIEYEAGPDTGFVIKSFTKEPLQSGKLEKESDTVYDKDGLNVRKDHSPEKSTHSEENTEESYPKELVRGVYTVTDEDGIPVTVEYEAGPKIGFVVTKISKGDVQIEQTGQITGIPLNTDILLPSSIQEDSSAGQPIVKFNGNINKDLSSQNNTKIHSSEQEDFVEQPDVEGETEIPMSSAYTFGFSVQDQSRHEEADSMGTIHGNYSYVDGAGLLTNVKYEAGANKGYVIKQMTHEHTKIPNTALNSDTHQTQSSSIPEKDYRRQDLLTTKTLSIVKKENPTDNNIVLQQHNKLNNQRDKLDKKNMDGYEIVPQYVLKEYVDERNIPVRSEFNADSGDLTVPSESTNQFSIVRPESVDLKSDGSDFYTSPQTSNKEDLKRYFPRETNQDLTSPYSIFIRVPEDSGVQEQHELPTLKSYKHMSYLPSSEPRPEYSQLYQNVLNKEIGPYITESARGFSVYGPPLPNVFSKHPDNRRKAGDKKKQHQKRKKTMRRPMNNNTTSPSFMNIYPDGSYSFAYRAKDHSREQSIDRFGNVNYRYQVKSKKYGDTLVIVSTRVPQNVPLINDEIM